MKNLTEIFIFKNIHKNFIDIFGLNIKIFKYKIIIMRF